uniref:Glutamyl-tRNA(Gln) amidotransferase subunit B, mitochondrial n=1 Tax=Timema poppense TaxID=170557 RepID=A0A7R9CP97_TIMPO|nr:unnamed protein product [Timema poppensis]
MNHFKRENTGLLRQPSQTLDYFFVSRSNWESVVGLEIHAQISSVSKLFSGAGTQFASPVNESVSFFDAAIPGTLPVLNRRCVEAGIVTALALSCKINSVSMFDRKHYFYADLPAGYQITQQRAPLAQGGQLQFQVFTPGVHKEPYSKTSHIHQLQLEQDSGRSLHDDVARRTLIDLNRAGIPLMEIVFEPDLQDGEEAAALVRELSMILERLGTCSCRMDEGALRVDANISVHKKGSPLGIRTEVKNIGSVRAVAHAIQFEIDRQVGVLELGGSIVNETRSWDAQCRQTLPMRDKEEKQDYRFMPEPNLPPLRVVNDGETSADLSLVNVNELKTRLPELPAETRQKLGEQFRLPAESIIILVNENLLLQHFRNIMKENESRDPIIAANLLIMDFLTSLNKNKINIDNCNITSSSFGELVDLLQNGTLNLMAVRKILDELLNGNPHSPSKITEMNGWAQITNPLEIKRICEDVIIKNPDLVAKYLQGKTKIFKALIGEVAKFTKQRANMALVTKELEIQLKKQQ